jgi:hypothetical protein
MFDRDEVPAGLPAGPASAPVRPALEALLNARVPAPPADLHHALNHNQIACKTWLLDALFGTLGGRFGTVSLLGGWYGVLGALLLGDERFRVDRVLSYDIDPDCARVARGLNHEHVAEGRFEALTADVRELDYASSNGSPDRPAPGTAGKGAAGNGAMGNGAMGNGAQGADLVINTSCEHMAPTSAWYDRVPPGTLQVHQSNDYFDCPEHVNCVADLEAFKADLPMGEVLYQGSMARKRYTRFMLIGRK